MSASRVAAYDALISSLSGFSGDTALTGSAYQSAKDYASSVMIPIVQGGILLSEAVSKAMSKFPADYSSQVAPESLDSEELQKQIDAYQKSYDSTLAWYNSAKNKKSVSAAALESAQRTMMGTGSNIEELKEKKRKLEAFDGISSSIFSDIQALESAVTQGLAVATGSFGSYNGTFSIPNDSNQMAWTKTISTKWEESVEDGSIAYYKVRAKITKSEELTKKDVKAIQKYQEKHPDVVLDKEVYKAVDNYVKTEIQKKSNAEKFAKGYIYPSFAGAGTGTVVGYGYDTLVGCGIEEKYVNKAVNQSLEDAKNIRNNRYLMKNSSGDIIGKIPGETHKTIVENTDNLVKDALKNSKITNTVLGEVASFGPGAIVGVGIDMASGDTAEEAWGKEITTGAATVGIGLGIEGLSAGLLAIGAISNPISLGFVGAVAIGMGVNIANDIARDKFPEFKNWEDNIGESIVSGWNSLVGGKNE